MIYEIMDEMDYLSNIEEMAEDKHELIKTLNNSYAIIEEDKKNNTFETNYTFNGNTIQKQIADMMFDMKMNDYNKLKDKEITFIKLSASGELERIPDDELNDEIFINGISSFGIGGDYVKEDVKVVLNEKNLENYSNIYDVFDEITKDGFYYLQQKDYDCELKLKIEEGNSIFEFNAISKEEPKLSIHIKENELNTFFDKTLKYIALNDGFNDNDFFNKGIFNGYTSYLQDNSEFTVDEKYAEIIKIRNGNKEDILNEDMKMVKIENLEKNTNLEIFVTTVANKYDYVKVSDDKGENKMLETSNYDISDETALVLSVKDYADKVLLSSENTILKSKEKNVNVNKKDERGEK